MIVVSELLAKQEARTIIYKLLRKILRANFTVLQAINMYLKCNYYFILQQESKKYNIESRDDTLYGYTYYSYRLKKYIVQIYLDDWYIKEYDKIIIGHNYYTLSELARRISHELTHVYALMKRKQSVHQYIDEAVKNGMESNMLYWKNIKGEELGLGNLKLAVYDVKRIVDDDDDDNS